MNILVTGGAGYIGSFMVKKLLEDGNEVTVFDSLERGHENAIDKNAHFVKGNILDSNSLGSLGRTVFDGIIHFAGYISMGESVENPGLYFENNSFGALKVMEFALKNNIKNFIFSSTAGVYGNPVKIPIPEDHPKNPTNPYGSSKLLVEQMLGWYSKIYDLNSIALRYFNAAGASLDGKMGEDHNPETHIIPNIINAILNNSEFSLFGTDYDTVDGTCVRDYIHVLDLVVAHMLALKKLQSENGHFAYNVGAGVGHSNKEVIQKVEQITGRKLKVKEEKRRAGDASELVADSSMIKKELNFSPKHSDLETIVKTAWEWHRNLHKSR